MPIKAVIFDLGGVVLDSPMEIFREFEKAHGLPPDFLNHLIVNMGPRGAWSRLERGEISLEAFFDAFDQEIHEAGGKVSSRALMAAIHESSSVRPQMIEALKRIRSAGLKTAALTNNWFLTDGCSTTTGLEGLKPIFDVFVESSRAGVAKPDPAIYGIVLTELAVSPQEAVFLDDIGRNLKPAREMGMATIKVESTEAALSELEALLGVSLTI